MVISNGDFKRVWKQISNVFQNEHGIGLPQRQERRRWEEWKINGYFSKTEKRKEMAAWRTTTWRRRFQKLKREEEDGDFEYLAVKKKKMIQNWEITKKKKMMRNWEIWKLGYLGQSTKILKTVPFSFFYLIELDVF